MQRGLLFLHLRGVAAGSVKPIFKPQDSSTALTILKDPKNNFFFIFFLMDTLDLGSWAEDKRWDGWVGELSGN